MISGVVHKDGIRNASATLFYPIFHMDFQDLIVLKNNQGTEETRVRHLDYTVVLNGYFLKLFKEGKDIYFFNPNEVTDLYDAFYSDTNLFVSLYEKYINDTSIKTKIKISSEVVFMSIVKERRDTGRIYLTFIDNIMNQGPYDQAEGDIIYSNNLCQEIALPTKSFKSIDDESGRIALCTLGSMNWGKYKNPEDMENDCGILVEALSNILSYQDFLSIQSKLHNEEYEPLGIGVTGLAHWAAKRKLKYGSSEMLAEVKRWIEHQSYYCIRASVELSKKKGPCKRWKYTRYGKGQFPWENRKKTVDSLTDFTPSTNLDWEELRQDMLSYGMRNTTLLAIAPVESSSVCVNSTNGFEMPMHLISVKESKSGMMVQVVPEYEKFRNDYQLMWNQPGCREYLKVAAVLAAYVDQSISTNTFYNLGNYPEGKIPSEVVLGDIIFAYNHGLKSIYYDLSHDPKFDNYDRKDDEGDCIACKL